MQPYANPYYFQQPMFQQPTYQPPVPQVSTLNGRLIDNIETVTANDVSMQGISVFPKNDLSEVYIKSWTPQGTIATYRFKKMTDNAPVSAQVDTLSSNAEEPPKWASYEVTESILNRLSDIENKLDKVLSPVKGRKAQNESSNDI